MENGELLKKKMFNLEANRYYIDFELIDVTGYNIFV